MARIITATERLAKKRKINIVIFGPSGVGKTWQARYLDPKTTLVLSAEAGDLSLGSWPGASIDVRSESNRLGCHPWELCRALAVWFGGPDPTDAGGAYSKSAYEQVCKLFTEQNGGVDVRDQFEIIFTDSITVAARWCLDWAQKQPEVVTNQDNVDMRKVYGLLGREMVKWATHWQHCPKSVVLLGILNKTTDDFNRVQWVPQIDGSKTSLELPGIFDEVLSLVTTDEVGPDGQQKRVFVTNQNNAWGYPAKDRSGALAPIEEANLANVMEKIRKTLAQ